MLTSTAKILIVDDFRQGREAISDLIEEDFGFKVCSPNSFPELRDVIAFELFDSILADVYLEKWDIKEGLNNHHIQDGIDIAKFYHDIHKSVAVLLYSSQAINPFSNFSHKVKDLPFNLIPIPKPLPPTLGEIKEIFKPFLQETDRLHKANPLFQPPSYLDKSLKERLQVYKKVSRLNERWLNFHFQTVEDRDWAMICGRNVDRMYHGMPLNEVDHHQARNSVDVKDAYPSRETFRKMAEERNYSPFIFWNTRSISFLEKHFALAGPHLSNLPEELRHFFGTGIAPLCAKAYVSGMRSEVINWCKHLTGIGQIEVVAHIYRTIADEPSRKDFNERCVEAALPWVVEMYEARVDEIEESTGTAWVELKLLGDYAHSMAEAFDLEKLRENDVSFKNQPFEYIVYELADGDVAMKVEPAYLTNQNPFEPPPTRQAK